MKKHHKPRVCSECHGEYIPTGPAQRYCGVCGPRLAKLIARRHIDAYRLKMGVRVGVGSGNGQPKGKEHPQWKNGVSIFLAYRRTVRQLVRYCERCKKDLLNAQTGEWATHHRDHNPNHNEISNFELLCKRCHQLEHGCAANLPSTHQPDLDLLPLAA